MFRRLIAFCLLTAPVAAMADTIPGHALVDFEGGSDGSTVTASIMTSSTKGQTWSGWKTLSNPGGAVQGSTPNLKISSAASYQLYTPALIGGTTYSGAGTRGMRASMGGDNAVQINLPSPGYQLSVGFYFRFSGPQINYSPRDVVGLRADPTGGYQFLQIYDGPQPYFHAHWQPYSSGSGIGNNVNFNRDKWYWVTMKHVGGGGTFRIRFYDPSKNYALVGESTGGVSSGTQGCTAIQIGCIKYGSGGTQSADYDNFIINTDGVFPLGPGAGGSFPANQPPVVTANASPKTGVAPLSVAFSSAGSSDPEGASLSYSWTFGDGTTSTSANPNKTYSTAGTYTARLTVSDGTAGTTSSNITITVSVPANQPPVALANATPRSGVAPLAVSFSSAGSLDPDGGTLTYSWTFGDGTTSTSANPNKTYSTAGTYTARLNVSDGTASTTSSNITITVNAPVNQPPVAAANANPKTGVAPLTVSFSSAGSSDPEGSSLSYSWSFGDGTTSTSANPNKTYSTAGTYVAKLTVSDGNSSVTSGNITITVSTPANQPPVVAANASPTTGVAPLNVAFSSAGSSDPEGSSLTYSWNFGDGTTSTSANPNKTYSTAGTYTARLTASDGAAIATSGNLTITVSAQPINQPPVSIAGAANPSGVTPLAVNFSSAGSLDPEGAALTYQWIFGDGTTSTSANPNHTYVTAGSFVARLTVSDGTNSVQSSPLTITAWSPGSGLVAAFGFEDTVSSAVTDVSGNSNHGTTTGKAWALGKYGWGLVFNGSNSLVTVSDSASLRLTSGMTLEAWVYPTSATTTWKPVIFKPYDSSQISYVLQGSTPSGVPSFYISPSTDNLLGTTITPQNVWTHLAATYDGSTMRLYMNGAQVSSKAQTGTVVTSSEPLTIGGNALYDVYWSGLMDEVRIYNRALTASEIQSDMLTPVVETGSPRPSPPPNLPSITDP